MAHYEQPTKDQIAKKLAEFTQGQTPNWEGFITWVADEIDMAYRHAYDEGVQDGVDGVEEEDDEDESETTATG